MAKISKKSKTLPIDTSFKLPSGIPSWPPGEGFGEGIIDLGGLQVRQVSTFKRVWFTKKGGPGNIGASFSEPSGFPGDFFMLGCYCQSNNRLLHGWVLVGRDSSNEALKKPIDYNLVWKSKDSPTNEEIGCIWLPVPPAGYRAVGHVVTTSPGKPSLDKIRCVRSEFTDECEPDDWVWGSRVTSSGCCHPDRNSKCNIFSLRPKDRRTTAMGVSVGTFVARVVGLENGSTSLACLKNVSSHLSSMPNLSQTQALFQAYSPRIYFHPDEKYLPSSVDWYLQNGVSLVTYMEGEKSPPKRVEATGSNLPIDWPKHGSYWLDHPVDKKLKELVRKGNLENSQVYLQVKPMFGATFTDIVVWLFYPFNGPGRLKLMCIDVQLRRTGQHIGDWEHMTLRISNFDGKLWGVYFSQHSAGYWVDASKLDYHKNSNNVIAYSSLHGHAMYAKAGQTIQGCAGIGPVDYSSRSNLVLDAGKSYLLVSADYLGGAISVPPWLNYFGRWGPKIEYGFGKIVHKVENSLPGKLASVFKKVVKILPNELLEEEGPTGPKTKISWIGDEKLKRKPSK